MRLSGFATPLLCGLLAVLPAFAGLDLGQAGTSEDAAPAALGIELNKFEQAESGACRAFFLFHNRTGNAFESFEMSLAVFDAQGVIDRLLTIDAAPIPVARTTLKLFEIPETRCDAISEILLHDITACAMANQPAAECFGLITLGSRTPAALVQ